MKNMYKKSSTLKIYHGYLGHCECNPPTHYASLINNHMCQIHDKLDKTFNAEQKKLLLELSWAVVRVHCSTTDVRYNVGFQIGLAIGYECSTMTNNL